LLDNKSFWKKLIEEALDNKAEYNFLDFKLKLSYKHEWPVKVVFAQIN